MILPLLLKTLAKVWDNGDYLKEAEKQVNARKHDKLSSDPVKNRGDILLETFEYFFTKKQD